jgi:hypothetical protein
MKFAIIETRPDGLGWVDYRYSFEMASELADDLRDAHPGRRYRIEAMRDDEYWEKDN